MTTGMQNQKPRTVLKSQQPQISGFSFPRFTLPCLKLCPDCWVHDEWLFPYATTMRFGYPLDLRGAPLISGVSCFLSCAQAVLQRTDWLGLAWHLSAVRAQWPDSSLALFYLAVYTKIKHCQSWISHTHMLLYMGLRCSGSFSHVWTLECMMQFFWDCTELINAPSKVTNF